MSIYRYHFSGNGTSLTRRAVQQAVAKHAPWLKDACSAWYGGNAVHIVRDDAGVTHEVPAARGVDQGCPLGALRFALAMRDPIEEILRFARQLDPHAALFF